MWVLEIKLLSSARTVCILDCWAIFLAPSRYNLNFLFFIFWPLFGWIMDPTDHYIVSWLCFRFSLYMRKIMGWPWLFWYLDKTNGKKSPIQSPPLFFPWCFCHILKQLVLSREHSCLLIVLTVSAHSCHRDTQQGYVYILQQLLGQVGIWLCIFDCDWASAAPDGARIGGAAHLLLLLVAPEQHCA